MTAADKYYLKAKDYYPYEIEEALEALEYGLSADETHAGLLTLQGEIYFKDLRRFGDAMGCFSLAIYHDPTFTEVYYPYIGLLTEIEDLHSAALLVVKALKVRGINKPKIWHLEALIHEKQGRYEEAVGCLLDAKNSCQEKECFSFYGSEAKRILKKSGAAKKVEVTTAQV